MCVFLEVAGNLDCLLLQITKWDTEKNFHLPVYRFSLALYRTALGLPIGCQLWSVIERKLGRPY